MADVIIKKWNGTGWEEHYPKTTVGNIVATGTPSSTTFLRGDGTWSFVPIVTKADLTWTYVYGKAQSAITKGQAVQFAGVQGDHILLKPAVPSEINANPDYFVGVADATVATNDFLYVIDKGELRDVATNAYAAGTILWFASGGSTAGALTETEPTGTNAKIQVGAVTKSNATEGIILVRVNFVGTEIEDIVAGGSASSTTFLRGDGTWATPASASGDFLPLSGGTLSGTITIGGTSNKALSVQSGTNNYAYFGTFNDYALIGVNRNPSTGAFADNNKASADFGLLGENGNSAIIFGTTTTNGGLPSERMRITGAGNVGIGTTSPTDKLHIDVVTGGGDIIVKSGTAIAKLGASQDTPGIYFGSRSNNNLFLQTNNSTRMTVDTSGNVGIGTTSPQAKLHVSGTAGTWGAGLQIEGVGVRRYGAYVTGAGKLEITDENAGVARIAILSDGKVGIGTDNPPQKLSVNDGNINISGGFLTFNNGDVEIGRVTTGSGAGAFFRTWTGSALTEKMRITADGAVGIGTDSPGRKIDVNGSSRFRDTMFFGSSDDIGLISWNANGFVMHGQAGQGMAFGANGVNNYMYINTSGNVGIGTTSPSTKLHVVGTALATDLRPIGSTNNGRIYADDWGIKVGTDSGHVWIGPANTGHAHIYTDRPNFYFNKELLVNGNTVFHGGNSSFVQARVRTNWNDNTVINNVIGQLSWNNYGDSHTIFDASSTASPSGTTVDRVNSQIAWSSSYPTLMGWNGSATYGVRVDSSRNSDTVGGYGAGSLWRADGGTWNPGANISLSQTGNGQEWSFDISRNGFTGGYWHVWDSTNGSMLSVAAQHNAIGIRTVPATSSYALDVNGETILKSWLTFNNNGFFGLYSPNNGAHFYPNNLNYGAWRVAGVRNSYNGIEFDASAGNVSLMISPGSNTTGFHNNSYGWQFYWESGSLNVAKNTYGGGTIARVWDGTNLQFSLSGTTLTITRT